MSLVDEPGLLSSEKQESGELLSGLTGGLHCPCEDLALTHKCQGHGGLVETQLEVTAET